MWRAKKILFLFIPLAFFACKKKNMCDCFKTRGDTSIEDRTVSNFTWLHVYDKIDVYFTQDTTITVSTIKVVTGKHLMSNVTTEVVGTELRIRNENKCNFVRGSHNDVTVYVTAPNLRNVTQDGVGNLFFTNPLKTDSVDAYIVNSGDVHLNLNTAYMKAHMHGVGDLYAEGYSHDFCSYIIGQGFVHAEGLSANYVNMYYGSNGQAHVNVKAQIDATIGSTGNIYYTGNPPIVNPTIKGSGQLIHY